MKKFLCLFLVLIMLLSATVFAYDKPISVTLDGEKLIFDVEPALIDGRTMVPIRAIFEAMGAVVNWDNDTQTAICTKDDTVVKMTIDSPTIYINDVPSQMDTSPVIINGRTLAPARFVAESFGYKVDWDNENSIAKITSVENEQEKTPVVKNDEFVIDILDKFDGSFYDPYKNGLAELRGRKINFQPDAESEEMYVNLFFDMEYLTNKGYCKEFADKTNDLDPSFQWLIGKLYIKVISFDGSDVIKLDKLVNIDNFYFEDGTQINPLDYSFKINGKNISDITVEIGKEIRVDFEIFTDRNEKGYPVFRILNNGGKKAKYMHLLEDVPANYKNEKHLKPIAEKVMPLTETKEECEDKITEIKAEINALKEQLSLAYEEKNISRTGALQERLNTLELRLEKYEAYFKTFE